MSRWLLTLSLALLLVLSGCVGGVDFSDSSSLDPRETWDGHPDNHWQTEQLVVSYETPEGDDRDYEPILEEALGFWSEHAERYAGFPVDLRLAESDEQADIHVRFVDRVGECGIEDHDDEHTAGCAPVLTDHRQVDRPVEIRVRTGFSDESTALVLKHELGHTMGLTHDDEPQEIMQAQSELTTLPQTNATDRALPWRTNELSVYVDDGVVSDDDREATERQVHAALDYFERGAGGTVPDNVTFVEAPTADDAHVVIRFADSDPCRSGSGSCGSISGQDLDGDGAFEYHTKLRVTLVDLDTDAVAWHVGRWLGTGFGHVEEAEFPEPLREDTTFDDRRSEWWE